MDRNIHADKGVLSLPAIVVHGGAGSFERAAEKGATAELESLLTSALEAGWTVLAGGGSALLGAVAAVSSLEENGRFNAGRGAVATASGAVELDAAVMDGSSGAFGALCAATHPASPVKAALAISEAGGVPDGPVLLAGPGADRWCAEHDLEKMRPEWLAAAQSRDETLPASSKAGTVGAVAIDSGGHLAAATSTGGREGQLDGRIGDSPIPGAGTFAEDRSVAVSATGAGEAFLVTGFAHRVAWSVLGGGGLVGAVNEALRTVAGLGGDGGAIALRPDGEFVAAFSSNAMARGWRDETTNVVRIFAG
ncbi:MAG: isoaspartyl peptidase/L-asparaginase family protein [Acidimicrobiales bacterium]